MKTDVDLIIVGSGPAGIAAALQARRDGTVALLIGNEPPGGLAAAARRIENLPEFSRPISGTEFQSLLLQQLDGALIERPEETVLDCRIAEGGFIVNVSGVGEISCRTLLLACGTEPVTIALPGLESAAEAGLIHRDIRTLPGSLKNVRILVIGGGEAALDSALWIRDHGGEATICVRKDRIAACPGLMEELSRSSIAVRFGREPASAIISGDGLIVEMSGPAEHSHMKCGHLLLCIGRRPRLTLYWKLGGKGIPCDVITDIKGLFLAGDILREQDRYIAPALKDGIRAAVQASGYLAEL
jgi:thioredoxin reductase (NADPH)